MNTDVTPGTSTSEFQLSAAVALVSAIIGLVTVVHPGFNAPNADTQRWIATAAVAVIGLVSKTYTDSRSKIKSAALTATGTALAAQASQTIVPVQPATTTQTVYVDPAHTAVVAEPVVVMPDSVNPEPGTASAGLN